MHIAIPTVHSKGNHTKIQSNHNQLTKTEYSKKGPHNSKKAEAGKKGQKIREQTEKKNQP